VSRLRSGVGTESGEAPGAQGARRADIGDPQPTSHCDREPKASHHDAAQVAFRATCGSNEAIRHASPLECGAPSVTTH
jgi:hypothetical protein